MVTSEHQLVAFDGTPIFYSKVSPGPDVKAKAVILHGMGEYGARYLVLAQYLSNVGIECYMPDMRGFGKSGGPRAYVYRFEALHQDLGDFCSFVCRAQKKAPLYIIGHSFGGLLASSFAAFRPAVGSFRGLVLSSPIFGIQIPVPAWQQVFAGMASMLVPRLTQGSRVDAATLTHDPVILQKYRVDSLIYRRITARLYTELCSMISRKNEIASNIHCPTLVLQAGDDRVVSKSATLDFYTALAAKDKELEVYADWYHEILNEVGREKVFEKIRHWMLGHL